MSFTLVITPGHAFRLFRAQIKREAQAVFGNHHRHVAGFFVRFKGRFNQLHTKALIKGAGFFRCRRYRGMTAAYPDTPVQAR